MKTIILSVVLMGFFMTPALAAIEGQEVDYKVGDKTFKGYLAYDNQATEKRPGILVVHEWWGQNDYARQRARMLAELGYVAFALDMYGDGKIATHPDQAGQFSQEVASHQEEGKARFLAALAVLQNFRLTDSTRIAAIGYCFGGGVVLNMALSALDDLAGVVSFHGGLVLSSTQVKPSSIKTKVLICHGGADQFISADQVKVYKEMLEAAKVDYQLINYPGAKHSFTNPDADQLAQKFNLPIGYNKEADEKSWQDMQQFFKKIF